MAQPRVKTWVKEVLTFADLNAEFNNILNNARDVVSPLTDTLEMNGNALVLDADDDTSIVASTDDQIDITIGGVLIYTITASTFDFNGKRLDLDADADSSLRETADDVLALELQGFDAFIFDGDVGSPVNGLTFKSSSTGTYPSITAQGTDTDIGLNFVMKGAGNFDIDGGTGAILINAKELVLDDDLDTSITCDTDDRIDIRSQAFDFLKLDGSVVDPVNGMTIAATATGVPATITAHGENPAGINLVPNGAEAIYIDGGKLAGKCFNNSMSWNPGGGSVADGSSVSTAITMTGAVLGDFAIVSTNSTDYTSSTEVNLTAHVSAADEATIVLYNNSGGAFTPGSDTYYVRVLSLA